MPSYRKLRERVSFIELIRTPAVAAEATFSVSEVCDPDALIHFSDILTVPASLAGLPALSLPCGFVEDGPVSLPVGLQLIGAQGRDARVLRVGRAFQEATAYHLRLPPLAAADGGPA